MYSTISPRFPTERHPDHTESPRRFWSAVLVSTLLAAGTIQAAAQSFLIDFGAQSVLTANGAAPNDPVNFWNNVYPVIAASSTGQLLNLTTTLNASSDFDLFMVSPFANNQNQNGTTTSSLYPANATSDSLFGNTEVFNSQANVTPVFKFSSLDLGMAYNFTFYASRTGVTDNRETRYTVTGANSGFGDLNVANNINNTASVFGITPDGAGEITIALTPTANNNNGNHFIYLGVLKMEATAVPEPTTMAMALGAGLLLSLRRRLA